MKKLIIYTVGVLTLIAGSANAGSDLCIHRFPKGYCGAVTKIYCSYQSRDGSLNNLIFQLPANMDFRNISGPTISLRINNGARIGLFNVNTKVQGSEIDTELYYQNPFFISYIQLNFMKESKENALLNPVKGLLIADYPPAIEMQCNFSWGNP